MCDTFERTGKFLTERTTVTIEKLCATELLLLLLIHSRIFCYKDNVFFFFFFFRYYAHEMLLREYISGEVFIIIIIIECICIYVVLLYHSILKHLRVKTNMSMGNNTIWGCVERSIRLVSIREIFLVLTCVCVYVHMNASRT